MENENIKISFIIVTYNSEHHIQKCLASLLKNLPKRSEIMVCDNASSDRTLEKLQEFESKIKIIKSNINLGFSKANNLVAKQAKGEYLFLLNPDTEINFPIFDELVNYYEDHENIGIIAPKLMMIDGKVQPSAKNLPTLLGAFNEYILDKKNSYSEYIPKSEEPIEVEAVYGGSNTY